MQNKNSITERLLNGMFKENPTFVLMLGMCPTLAVTTSAVNGLGMGLTTTVVLALSNLIISALRKVIPDKVRIPAYIVIVASFVTMMQLLLQGFLPFLYEALGIYIPLIVVNCIILGRAESYASKNPVMLSLFDGIGMGLGFSLALTCIGAVRELLGAGELFGFQVMPDSYVPASIFIMAPGAFFVLAVLTAIQNKVRINGEKKGRDMSKIQSGCENGCASCKNSAACSNNKQKKDAEDAADVTVAADITYAAEAVVSKGTEPDIEDLQNIAAEPATAFESVQLLERLKEAVEEDYAEQLDYAKQPEEDYAELPEEGLEESPDNQEEDVFVNDDPGKSFGESLAEYLETHENILDVEKSKKEVEENV